MDWKKIIEQMVLDYKSRKFLLTVLFMALCIFNYAQISGIGEFGLPVSVLALVAFVTGLFIWQEGEADQITRQNGQ